MSKDPDSNDPAKEAWTNDEEMVSVREMGAAAVSGDRFIVIGGWAAFRPELLFVNNTVNEALPQATPSAMAMVRTACQSRLAGWMFW